MLSLIGTYENGYLKLDKDFTSENPVKVIVTFLEEIQIKSEESLTLTDFSFSESKKNLQNYKGSFAESVIEDRRLEYK
jgi:hypothetical protein